VTDARPQALGLLAKLVIAGVIFLILAGVLWHGITFETFQRIWHNLLYRTDAPMRFRFILQPLMSAIAAVHDGLEDVRAGRPPIWTVMRDPQQRAVRLREALNATARIILLGIAMDVIYQLTVLRTFYPVESVIIAVLLAFVPYLIIRGPVVRALRRRGSEERASGERDPGRKADA
jgi:hypothetical protein